MVNNWDGFRMADAAAAQSWTRFRRTRSVSLSGDAEFVRTNVVVNNPVYTGRKSSDYGGTKERWAASRLSLHHEFLRTFSSSGIDQYRAVNGSTGDRKSLSRLCLSDAGEELHFNCLPDDCREHVFSFLTINERGIAAQVGLVNYFTVIWLLANCRLHVCVYVCVCVCVCVLESCMGRAGNLQ